MWLLRSLMYMAITPFHPIYGFSKAEEDEHSNRVRRFAFWGGIFMYLILYYFLLIRILFILRTNAVKFINEII